MVCGIRAMIVIKRYPNRKLYDTSAKRYVTLDGVAELILDGEEVQIVDNATGEDLTTVTLTQIMFEQEKKQGGFFPRSVLTGLLQSGGHRLSNIRRTLASPLELFHHVDQEIEKRITTLIDMGELTAEEGQNLLDKLLAVRDRSHADNIPSDEELERLLEKHGVPTEEDLRELNKRLDELVAKLDEINLEKPTE